LNPFDFQVQAITHHSVGALCAVKEGSYIAQPDIPLVGYEALLKMISDAQAALRQILPEATPRNQEGEVGRREGGRVGKECGGSVQAECTPYQTQKKSEN